MLHRGLDVIALARFDDGRKLSAPAREQGLRFDQLAEHGKVLMFAEPLAQPLGFADPYL